MSDVRVVMLGPPGAGKGTQGAKIESTFDIDHVSTGDILRANKDMKTEHGTPREYMEAGELLPDVVMEAVVEEALSGRDSFILDGYPRTIGQAEHLDAVTDLDIVLHLDVDRSELIDRLSGRRVDPETGENYHVEFDMPDNEAVRERLIQREDDQPAKVERRLDVYDEETAPVVEYYVDREEYVKIDGNGSPDEVFEQIAQVIADHGVAPTK